jgi:predicted Zn finger-like uncharacterized protein
MPVNAVCPKCRTSYLLGDQQNGKKVRCKKCQAIFVAAAAKPAKGEEPLEVGVIEEPPPRPKSRPAPPEVEVIAEPPPKPKPRPAPASVTNRHTVPKRAARDAEEDRRPRRRDREEYDDRPALRWAIAGVAVGLLLLVVGGLTVYLVTRNSDSREQASKTTPANNPSPAGQPPPFANMRPPWQPANPNPNPNPNLPIQPPPITPQPITPQPITPQPVKPADPPPVKPADPPVKPADPDPPPAAGNGQISPQMVAKVKRATVYLKVTMPNDLVASGTGFFGVPEAPNLILTNAHVVGMLSPDSRRPKKIEVHINSGQTDERTTEAGVLGVDRASDLAVLDIGNSEGTPEPLTVKSARGLVELTKLYTFGFPLGESLGKEITIRETSVGSLRRKNGTLERIQVNGGMDPGNSGGPVVDGNGHVVGVAVSGYEGRLINFAIPGDRVHGILNGRISAIGIGMAFYAEDRRVGFPVNIEMIDPRHRIKEVALDVWTGNAPPPRGVSYRSAADAQPAAEAGDSQHLRYQVPYEHGIARGDIVLPELPAGKVWWVQPNWVNAAGESHWASANVWKLSSEPVERKPATLAAVRLGAGAGRLTLTATEIFKISDNDDDEDAPRIVRTKIVFNEQAMPYGSGGGTLRLKYQQADRKVIEEKKAPRPAERFEAAKADLLNLVAVLQLDAQGNVTQNGIDPQVQAAFRRFGPAGQARFQQVSEVHSPIQAALEALSVRLPGREVKPMESWKGQRPLPMDKGRHRFQSGQLDLTFTYLGQRRRNGRNEAVIAFEGTVRATAAPGGKDPMLGGKATGAAYVDLTTGQVTMSETRLTLEIDIPLKLLGGKDDDKTVRLLAILGSRLERGL